MVSPLAGWLPSANDATSSPAPAVIRVTLGLLHCCWWAGWPRIDYIDGGRGNRIEDKQLQVSHCWPWDVSESGSMCWEILSSRSLNAACFKLADYVRRKRQNNFAFRLKSRNHSSLLPCKTTNDYLISQFVVNRKFTQLFQQRSLKRGSDMKHKRVGKKPHHCKCFRQRRYLIFCPVVWHENGCGTYLYVVKCVYISCLHAFDMIRCGAWQTEVNYVIVYDRTIKLSTIMIFCGQF